MVFIYALLEDWVKNVWDELHILRALRGRHSFVQFHRAVIDDIQPRLLGFTVLYIPGPNMASPTITKFPYQWLRSLTEAIDYLNLDLGVAHQDVAPRNVIIDERINEPVLMDFDVACKIGNPNLRTDRNDVNGMVFLFYETVTRDTQFSDDGFNPDAAKIIESKLSWPVHLTLEDENGGIEGYRKYLMDWVTRRRSQSGEDRRTGDPGLNWEPMRPPTPFVRTMSDGRQIQSRQDRQDAIEKGDYFVDWERRPLLTAHSFAG